MVQVTMEAGSHARVRLQEALAAAGLQPECADKYLCGSKLDSRQAHRYAYKHSISGQVFIAIRKVVDQEKSSPLDCQPSSGVRVIHA